jgi:hypothetical protein
MTKTTLPLIAAVTASLLAHDAFGQEEPPGCNASAVGVRLVPTVNLVPIPPDTCVIPGQGITYRTNPFISSNPPPQLGIVYCDVLGGQLGVTLPNWEAALPPGSLRPDQFVPTVTRSRCSPCRRSTSSRRPTPTWTGSSTHAPTTVRRRS